MSMKDPGNLENLKVRMPRPFGRRSLSDRCLRTAVGDPCYACPSGQVLATTAAGRSGVPMRLLVTRIATLSSVASFGAATSMGTGAIQCVGSND